MQPQTTSIAMPDAVPSKFKRWVPLFVLAALMASAYGLGLQNYVSLQSLADHEAVLQDYIANHLVLALLGYALVYITVVALCLPGAGFLSIFGGFAFGWAISAPITVIAATIGAVIVFQIVKTSLGATIAERAGPFVQKLSDGFARDGFNYLLFLRLVPAFPFFAINAAAGLTKMNLRTFALGTFIGIIPGSFAFAWLGRGLGSAIESEKAVHDACAAQQGAAACPYDLSVSALVTPQLLWAFAALGVVSLIPIIIKRLRRQS